MSTPHLCCCTPCVLNGCEDVLDPLGIRCLQHGMNTAQVARLKIQVTLLGPTCVTVLTSTPFFLQNPSSACEAKKTYPFTKPLRCHASRKRHLRASEDQRGSIPFALCYLDRIPRIKALYCYLPWSAFQLHQTLAWQAGRAPARRTDAQLSLSLSNALEAMSHRRALQACTWDSSDVCRAASDSTMSASRLGVPSNRTAPWARRRRSSREGTRCLRTRPQL